MISPSVCCARDSMIHFWFLGGLWEREGKIPNGEAENRETQLHMRVRSHRKYTELSRRCHSSVAPSKWPKSGVCSLSCCCPPGKNLSGLFCLESLELIACWFPERELEFLKNSWELLVVRSGEHGRWSTCSYKFYWNEVYLIIMRLVFWRAVCPEQWLSNFFNKLPLRGKGNEFKLYKCGLEQTLKGEDFFEVSCFALDSWDFCILLGVTSVPEHSWSKVCWCCRKTVMFVL